MDIYTLELKLLGSGPNSSDIPNCYKRFGITQNVNVPNSHSFRQMLEEAINKFDWKQYAESGFLSDDEARLLGERG